MNKDKKIERLEQKLTKAQERIKGLHRNDVIPASCMASRRNSKYRSSVKPKPHASSP